MSVGRSAKHIPGYQCEIIGEIRGGNNHVRRQFFHYACMSRSPTLIVEVTTGDLDKEELAPEGAAMTFGRGFRDAAAGSTSDYVMRFFRQPFCSYLRQDRSHAEGRLGWSVAPLER
jgi:hypothetical protein